MPSNEAAPGSFSTYSSDMPRCAGSAPGSVLHSRTTRPARSPFVTHILVPFTTKSVAVALGAALMAWTSDPAPGSDMESAARSSPVAILGSHRSRCSSDPYFLSRYTAMKWVFMIPERDIQPRDSSTPTSA